MELTVKPVPNDPIIFIGEENQQIGLTVQNTPSSAVSINVLVTINCDKNMPETNLVASSHTLVKATYKLDGQTGEDAVMPSASPKNQQQKAREETTQQWATGKVPLPASKKLTITLHGFVSKTPPGVTTITADVYLYADNKSPENQSYPISVTKKVKDTKEPKVHFFTVDPPYILNAGQTPVAVTFYATGYDLEDITLRRNNQPVEWRPSGPQDKQDNGVFGHYQENPSITSVYDLEITVDGKVVPTAPQTVQVISSGWNSIALPHGSPVQLWVANDLGPNSSGKPRLYGILRDKKGHFALYSSETGVVDWRAEDGTVPQDMAMSPGVTYKNKLWLIGGSSVDSKKPSTDVYCYEKDPNEDTRYWTKMEMEAKSQDNHPPTARMGHACVVVPRTISSAGEMGIAADETEMGDQTVEEEAAIAKVVEEIWVLGGYNNAQKFNDLWRLTLPEDSKKVHWEKETAPSPWVARTNLAAATFRNRQGPNEVWIYGGGTEPESADFNDLWSTDNGGKTWKQMIMSGQDFAIVPDPGMPLGATLVAFPEATRSTTDASTTPDSTVDRRFLIGSFKEWATRLTTTAQEPAPADGAATAEISNAADIPAKKVAGNRISSFIFEWHAIHTAWEARPVFGGWQQFQGRTFQMQAIVFNNFMFVWSLRSDMDDTYKLNILI